jgi:dCTP deaminase
MQSELEEKKLQYSLLSDKAILEHMEKGTVVITPFARDNLSTSSYDVTLGPYYFRERQLEFGSNVYNPFDKEMVDSIWGKVQKAELSGEWSKRTGMKLENIRDDEMIIWIRPGETILAHTNEFIGGSTTVTSMMKSRSSMGRNFIVCIKLILNTHD